MRLFQQALIAGCCLWLGGCARLLQTLIAPQQAAMSTASTVANQATAAPRAELAKVGAEVDRLLAGRPANQVELERIRDEIERRMEAVNDKQGAAQDDPGRRRPWHPRVPAEPIQLGPQPVGDELRLGLHAPMRGQPPPGPLPDGIAAGELQTPLSLIPMRVVPRR